MKYVFAICVFLTLALAACDSGREEADPPAGPDAAQSTQDEATEQTPAASGEEQPADNATSETKVVEESATVSDDLKEDDQSIKLAQAKTPVPAGDWEFTEGKHFHRLVPTQPTVGGADKIEVAEIFWYGCPHCFDFEPYINRWADSKPANVRFVRIPAVWNPLLKLHAQLYYTELVLAENGKIEDPKEFHAAVFREYHRRGNRMTSEDAIQSLFERLGVGAEEFQSTWKSFEVAQKLRVAEDLTRRYDISGVPAIVVNGKYRTGTVEAGDGLFPRLLEIIDELVARETAR
ncbi:MAG: thiol:disulfide interchange protein DsbA/DsbL [Woeseiaceae bacterium]